jgi:hypothetical protein
MDYITSVDIIRIRNDCSEYGGVSVIGVVSKVFGIVIEELLEFLSPGAKIYGYYTCNQITYRQI